MENGEVKVIECRQTVRTTDVVHIKDSEKDVQWFMAIEMQNGVFESIREMINPDHFKSYGFPYMYKIYDLAYKTATRNL